MTLSDGVVRESLHQQQIAVKPSRHQCALTPTLDVAETKNGHPILFYSARLRYLSPTDLPRASHLTRSVLEGRKQFQRCYLWTPSKKTSKLSCDPAKDGPQVAGKCPVLPGAMELKSTRRPINGSRRRPGHKVGEWTVPGGHTPHWAGDAEAEHQQSYLYLTISTWILSIERDPPNDARAFTLASDTTDNGPDEDRDDCPVGPAGPPTTNSTCEPCRGPIKMEHLNRDRRVTSPPPPKRQKIDENVDWEGLLAKAKQGNFDALDLGGRMTRHTRRLSTGSSSPA